MNPLPQINPSEFSQLYTQLGAIGLLILFGWQAISFLAKRNKEHVEQIDKLHAFYLERLEQREEAAREERKSFTDAMAGVKDALNVLAQELKSVALRLERVERDRN